MASWENDSKRLLEAFQGVRGVCALWACEERNAPYKTVYVKAGFVPWRIEALFDPAKEMWFIDVHKDRQEVRRVPVLPDQDVLSVMLGEWRSNQ